MDPGERKDTTEVKNEKGKNDPGSENLEKGDKDGDKEDEDPVPVDFSICMTDAFGKKYRVKLGDYQKLQPPIKPEVFKSRLFWDDPESEVILQYVSIPLEAFKDAENNCIVATEIRSIRFEFDAEKKGTVILDQIGFTR